MIIELQRAHTPEDMREEKCGICGRPFELESILAQAATDCLLDIGRACHECIELLGERYPERFPTIEEYREACRLYPEPIWPTIEEANRAWDDGSWAEAQEASWLTRASLAGATTQRR